MSKRAIVSIQHSGSHALMEHMQGNWAVTAYAPDMQSPAYKDVIGHIVTYPYDVHITYSNIDEWMEGREIFVPIRDLSALSFSWITTHGHSKEDLEGALTAISDFINRYNPTLIDICSIPQRNVSGEQCVDDKFGVVLADKFPSFLV